ncbi:peptidoglycan-binding protein [Streptomyces sp. A7024]|uniref:Peptidoglycan-binding protein n=1 Tax=Streptomyces coryli TaxID=1128680 RepID=A0A6G4TXK9_9ACTN|nr:peptidoglycan-binding domain-containing protein [Streptomyces coryli]NGN63741.1 peptidoglycan-binding protein [Streptomyces coryli]
MKLRTAGTCWGAATVALITAAGLGLGASPVSAAASDGYISGADYFFDDFGDEGTLSTTSYNNSNATCLWQRILVAEGANVTSSGGNFKETDMDGQFGALTRTATIDLQKRWGLTADGKVGKETFGRADKNLRYVSTQSDQLQRRYQFRYVGEKSQSSGFYRSNTGRWSFYEDMELKYGSYTYNTCD